MSPAATSLQTPNPAESLSGEPRLLAGAAGGLAAAGNHPIELQPGGKRYTAAPGQTLLDAGLAAGLCLPYQCRTGECGTCKATVLAGEVEHLPASYPLEKEGDCLLCRCQARGPVTLACAEVPGVPGLPLRKLAVRVTAIERPTADVAILHLQPPAGQPLEYLAGQYVDVLLRDGRRRSYSLATAPGKAEQLELHIRHLPGGAFTDHVFGRLKAREMLRLEGPFGTFYLRDSQAPMILLASGTGFAPIKALVEHARRAGLRRKAVLYWGARRREDIYHHALAQQWARELPWFSYVPVLSEANADWTGRRGLVHRAVLEDFADLSGHEIYACGAPRMVDAARRDFVAEAGLAEESFYADAFVSAAPEVA